MKDIRYYFERWRNITMYSKYDRWCEIQEEMNDEDTFARENNMESVYWCWNCKYSYCELH